MNLFIVESPAKCSKIKSFLDNDYNVIASYGHIREINPKGMNIDIKNGFEPTFSLLKGKFEVISKIKSEAEKAKRIFLASDPDREGAAIAFSIYSMLNKKNQEKCSRISFTEITKRAVLDALKNPQSMSEIKPLIEAQKARQVLDRLIGYSISPSVWKNTVQGTSAGRVQSIALRLVCDREREIQAFKSEDYWFINAMLACSNGFFDAKVTTKEKDNRFKEDPIKDLKNLKKASYTLDKIEKKIRTTNPYPPFDTTSMVMATSSLFGWSASKTMQVSQKLYEMGVQSYLRTDSYSISKEALDEVREHIGTMGCTYLPDKPTFYSKKSAASSQESHECIRPTHPADSCSHLVDDEKHLYDLIRARFLSCQMTPMVADTVAYHVKASSGHTLMAHGQVVKFDGWFKAYPYSKVKDEVLPEAKEGEQLTLRSIDSSKHSTQPPARYNDGSLVKAMEDFGVGRPSTRAPILKAIRDKGYVDKAGKAFTPTELGTMVYDFLLPNFNDFIMDYKFTAGLEDDLDLIAESKKDYIGVVKSVYDFMMKKIGNVKAIKKEVVQSGAKCPVCKVGDIVEKISRFGRFWSCSKYPTCKQVFVKNADGTFSEKGSSKKDVEYSSELCPKCNGKMVLRQGKYGKFHGCANYPKCHGMRKEDGTPVESKGKSKFKGKKKWSK